MPDGTHLWFVEEQAKSVRPCYRLYAVTDSQFLEDMGHMAFDGIQGDHQRCGNLLIRVAPCDQVEYFQFALTQGFY